MSICNTCAANDCNLPEKEKRISCPYYVEDLGKTGKWKVVVHLKDEDR